MSSTRRVSGTKIEMRGISASHERTPPEASSPAIFGPMMYPRPRYSGVTSDESVASGIFPFFPVWNHVAVSRQRPRMP